MQWTFKTSAQTKEQLYKLSPGKQARNLQHFSRLLLRNEIDRNYNFQVLESKKKTNKAKQALIGRRKTTHAHRGLFYFFSFSASTNVLLLMPRKD